MMTFPPHLLLSMTKTVICALDPYEDQFEKRRKQKDESVAKNEYQRLKNLAKGMKGVKIKGTVS